jgi:hypothetical protein
VRRASLLAESSSHPVALLLTLRTIAAVGGS